MSAARNVRTGGLLFDGRTGLVRTPYLDVFNGKPFTITLWYQAFMVHRDDAILWCCDAFETDRCLHLAVRDGYPYLGFWGDDLRGDVYLRPGAWYHLAFVWEGPEARTQIIYVNGEVAGTRRSTGVLTVTSGALSGYGVEIGRHSIHRHVGPLSDLRFFYGALPRSRIVLIYQRGEPIYENLELWYPMYETSGDVVRDVSGRNRHGTRIGGAYWMVKPSLRQLAPARVLPKAR